MDNGESASAASRAARKLGDLFASIEVRADWAAVEKNAQLLANELRILNALVDDRTSLGKTLLPQTLTSLLKVALEGSNIPSDERAPAVLELLRVGANLCMDHNENRGYLFDAGLPQELVDLLESYIDATPDIPAPTAFELSDLHLKIVRTIVGAVLNLTTDYEPIQSHLIALEAPSTLLRLSIAVYPPGVWRSSITTHDNVESWNIRKTIADWSLRAITNFKDTQIKQPLFGPESLAYMTRPLEAFIAPSFSANSKVLDGQTQMSFIASDVDVLEEVCELLESATMDEEDVRTYLGRSLSSNEPPQCLAIMLDFIEKAEYPQEWVNSNTNQSDIAKMKRVIDFCKTAVIRAVVELSGEDDNLNILWDIKRADGKFVAKLLQWIKDAQASTPGTNQDDLVICATLCLGNLVRGETQANALSTPPISIATLLVPYLNSETDFKLKHGVIGLLKHVSQTASTRPILGEARVLQALRVCRVFSDTSDISVVVQMSAINLVKHLCTHDVPNSIVCVIDKDTGEESTSCLTQILALARRSDSIHVKSEGARVLVNVIRSLCSNMGDLQAGERREAINSVVSTTNAATLAHLLGRSQKHGILLNEAIIAMCLLSLRKDGAGLVLDAITAELPKEASPSRQNSLDAEGDQIEPNKTPPFTPVTALDMLVHILENKEGKFPAELRANACSLLINVGQNMIVESGDRKEESSKVALAVRPMLEHMKSSPDSLILSTQAQKALSVW